MISKRKCESCGTKILKTEKTCPVCGAAFCCELCGKELVDGTQKYCPVCQMKKNENKKSIGKKVVTFGALLVGALVLNTRKKD